LIVRASPQAYSPVMSSAVGIELTPVLPRGAAHGVSTVHWHANYGYFVRWSAPDHRVERLGPDVQLDLGPICWSYDPKDGGAAKPEVEIVGEAQDDGGVVARGIVNVIWDGALARVRP
jgi:hypothetical protein